MASELLIRQAAEADLGQLMGLYRHLSPEDIPPGADVADAIWTSILQANGMIPLVGEVGGQLVTTCMLIVVPNLTRGGRSFAIIENVVTHPDFRRRGFGTAILREAINRAWARDCYKVVLTTGSKRETTLSFYERIGFKRGTRTAFELRRVPRGPE
jgi:GNAT superfamily N-acetyltransferase